MKGQGFLIWPALNRIPAFQKSGASMRDGAVPANTPALSSITPQDGETLSSFMAPDTRCQRSRPPRRRPRYPSLGALPSAQALCSRYPTVPAHFTGAISSLGAVMQFSARIAILNGRNPRKVMKEERHLSGQLSAEIRLFLPQE